METYGNNNGTRIVFGWGICSCRGEDLYDMATSLRGTTRLPGKTTPIVILRRSNMHHQTIDLPCTDQFIPVYQ